MKLLTKMATAAGAVGLAATGAVAALGGGSAVAQAPVAVPAVHLASAHRQVTPVPSPTGSTTVVEPATESATESVPEAPSPEPAREVAVAGGGHADAPGANVDHQFNSTE